MSYKSSEKVVQHQAQQGAADEYGNCNELLSSLFPVAYRKSFAHCYPCVRESGPQTRIFVTSEKCIIDMTSLKQ